MALNNSAACPRAPGLRSLRRDEYVKHLGLSISQEPVKAARMRFLDERLFDGFHQCFRRARTLRGRLLVALTMVLSRLSHYTVHVNVPAPTVRRWQALPNQFALTRRYDPASNHFHLISKEFVYQRREDGGLQDPNF